VISTEEQCTINQALSIARIAGLNGTKNHVCDFFGGCIRFVIPSTLLFSILNGIR